MSRVLGSASTILGTFSLYCENLLDLRLVWQQQSAFVQRLPVVCCISRFGTTNRFWCIPLVHIFGGTMSCTWNFEPSCCHHLACGKCKCGTLISSILVTFFTNHVMSISCRPCRSSSRMMFWLMSAFVGS